MRVLRDRPRTQARWPQRPLRRHWSHRATNDKPQPTLWESILPGMLPRPARRPGRDRRPSRRRAVLRSVPGRSSTPSSAGRRSRWRPPADDVPQVPLPAGVRAAVSRGVGLHRLATVLSHPPRPGGSAPDHADEDHLPLRRACRRRPQRRPARQGRGEQGHQDRQGAGGHHGGGGRRGVPDRLGPAGQGGRQAGPPGCSAQGRRPGRPHRRPGPHPLGASTGPCHRGVAAPTQRRCQGGGQGHNRRDGHDRHLGRITFDYLDTGTGEVSTGQIRPATRVVLRDWLRDRFGGRDDVAFAVEGCTGWRVVVEEMVRAGVEPHLAEPADTATQRGRKKRAKTDRTDARLQRDLLAGAGCPSRGSRPSTCWRFARSAGSTWR